MEDSKARQSLPMELHYGTTADGQLGVTLLLSPEATVTRDSETKAGMVLLPWQARLLAYTLLHHAMAVEHGLI